MGIWDYEEIQKQLNQTKESDDNVDINDLDNDADVGSSEEESKEEFEDFEEEGQEEEEPTEQKADEKEVSPSEKQVSDTDQKIAEEILKLVGDDVVLKVKNYEKKASELSPTELVAFLQKGVRSDQLFQEAAATRRQLEEDRALVEKGALLVQQYLDKINSEAQRGGEAGKLPDYLRPSPDDTEEVRAWKEAQVRVLDEVSSIKRALAMKESEGYARQITNEILELQKQYPMASIDEVLAVKSARPNIDSEELVRASHNYYSSLDFVKKALNANPTAKREYDDEVIRNYISRQNQAKKTTVPGKKRGSASVDNLTKQKKLTISDFDTADSLSRAYLKEVERLEREG